MDNSNTNPQSNTTLDVYYNLAKQGSSKAQYDLARCFETAYGAEKNEKEAVRWYEVAAKTRL